MSAFIVEFYDANSGALIGSAGESSHFGGSMPTVGDIVFIPESKKDFGLPRDPSKFHAHEVKGRYFFPTLDGAPCLVKMTVLKRRATDFEMNLL
ncbi:hypothetical protein [Bradyrhizobium sp. USDA 10063]